MNSISSSRNKLRDKLGELEDELRRTKEQVKQQGICAKNLTCCPIFAKISYFKKITLNIQKTLEI